MKKRTIGEISVAFALVAAVTVSMLGFGAKCERVRNEVVRLHILANSDSEADQSVKLLVRDALLESGSELFSGEVTKENAENCLELNAEKLEEAATRVLRENGFDYGVDIRLVNEYFSTRTYDDFTLPAGRYTAVKVLLGSGKGHNWWCVMFPPLCLPAASEKTDLDALLGTDAARLVESGTRYEMKFKIIEIAESIKEKFAKHHLECLS